MRTPPLDRDRQQWIFDYLVKTTGRVFHWDGEGRQLPASVKSHAQISKHLGRIGQRFERVAREEEDSGHLQTAMELYHRASVQFSRAQHPVLETNDEKRYLHGRCIANYEKVAEFCSYPLERIEVPFEGGEIQCYFHLLPGRPKAPTVLFIGGCDATKETYPDPKYNHAHDRGMHLLTMDGPGQGTSNIRGIKLTTDNYQRAALAVVEWLSKRDEVDENKIGVFSRSMGCHWGLEVACSGHPLVKAVVGLWASYIDKYYIMETFSPRYKQLFGYLTGAKSEEELNVLLSGMAVEGRESNIKCPVLLTVGEYDARCPIELVQNFYNNITAPKELWVYEDAYHNTTMFPGDMVRLDCQSMGMDWMVEAIGGKFEVGYNHSTFLRTGGGGPNGTQGIGQDPQHWWE
jgi:dienelactone hydrolase